MKDEFEKLFEKYGFEGAESLQQDDAKEKFKIHGREILVDLADFAERFMGEGAASNYNYGGPRDIEKLTFTVADRDTVTIAGTDPQMKGRTYEARFEDGKWRIHLGSLESLLA